MPNQSVLYVWCLLCYKKMCLKESTGRFLVCRNTEKAYRPFVIQKKHVQNKRGWFCNRKNVCSKKVRGCFFNLLIINNIILLKCFDYKFYKSLHERWFLVYLANYIKLLWTAAFNLLTVEGLVVRLWAYIPNAGFSYPHTVTSYSFIRNKFC